MKFDPIRKPWRSCTEYPIVTFFQDRITRTLPGYTLALAPLSDTIEVENDFSRQISDVFGIAVRGAMYGTNFRRVQVLFKKDDRRGNLFLLPGGVGLLFPTGRPKGQDHHRRSATGDGEEFRRFQGPSLDQAIATLLPECSPDSSPDRLKQKKASQEKEFFRE